MLRSVLHQPSVAQHLGHALAALRESHPDLAAAPEVRDLVHGLQASATLLRGEARSPAEDHAYVNSHPQVSLVQALLEEAAHTGRFSTHEEGSRPAAVPTDEPGRLARWRLRHPPETPFDDFGPWDIHWLEVVEEMIECWRERIDFRLPAAPPRTVPLADDARIIVLSDWGNGSDVAYAVAEQAKGWLRTAGDRECHVVHLGDVYYAGTRWEAEHRFLDFWPVEPQHPDRHHSWCLNGNHDMYAAGRGLTKTILEDPRFAAQRTTDGQVDTRFLLRGQGWQLIGLDTSWKFDLFDIGGLQGRLGRAEADRFGQVVAEFPGRSIALTHHQPISRQQDAPGPLTLEHALMKDSRAARDAGLTAWFWGHEHRCITYQGAALATVPGLGYGACIGYSAMPEEPSTVITGPDEWEYPGVQKRDHDGDVWRTCGLTVVDLAATGATISYVDQTGSTVRTDRLPAGPTTDPR